MTPTQQAILEEFDKKWKRMKENGFGTTVSLDGRMIWLVDSDDEDSYVFADETIKSFLTQTAERYAELRVGEMVEKVEKLEPCSCDKWQDVKCEFRKALSAVIALFKKN